MKQLVIVGFSILLLAGCNTSGQVQQSAQGGLLQSLSCDQINAYFDAYQKDKQSVTAFKPLADALGIDASKVNGSNVASYFDKTKERANVVLALQGCKTL